ncbi:MAG TPA: hypothetical protein VFI31_08170 [Pirellulales bacterium]|nr:hypothetical protein [Pirellulales bacterium]
MARSNRSTTSRRFGQDSSGTDQPFSGRFKPCHCRRSFYFYDGHNKVKYEYLGGDKPITKLPLGEDDAERILPIGALSEDDSAIGPWLLGEKIVEQQRRVFTEAGRPWVEFQLVLWRGEMNQVTLRVDPETRLPVYLLAASSKGSKKHVKWVFDYPEDGPVDIFALGVSRDVKIDNRMPADNVLTVLTAMAASRASIGDFQLLVGQSHGYPSSVVYRKGNKWRVDSWRPQVAIDSLPSGLPEQEMHKWLKEQLQLAQPMPLFVCDGQTVWENASFDPKEKPRWQVSQHTAPQDLMSGQGLGTLSKAPGAKIASLLFPDLSPKPGWGFEFDSKPPDAPDCLLIRQSAETTLPDMTAHEWYYVDPTKGYAVVRAELFTLRTGAPANPKDATALQTVKMESFRQSTQGFWYPTVVRGMMPVFAGNNPPGQDQTQPLTSMTRYCFDFNTDLPDSLFSVDDVAAPRN